MFYIPVLVILAIIYAYWQYRLHVGWPRIYRYGELLELTFEHEDDFKDWAGMRITYKYVSNDCWPKGPWIRIYFPSRGGWD
jgi:hypothetical protein